MADTNQLNFNILSQGLDGMTSSSLVTNGLWSSIAGQKPATVPYVPPSTQPSQLATISLPDGTSQRVTDSTQAVNLGGGQLLYLPTSGSSIITPALRSSSQAQEYSSIDEDRLHTFSGSDMRVMIEPIYQTGKNNNKQLIETTTLTVSIHREKAPVRAIGYINPKSFARGRRTIAGTMILTQFTVDIMYRFLSGHLDPRDASKDSFYLKSDQLPPFNMTLMFCDEYGHASYRRLLGVDIVTDGTVYSINDMMTEQTITYMASDFTPLLPLRRSVLLEPSDALKAEKTPKDMLKFDPMKEIANYNSQVWPSDINGLFALDPNSSEYNGRMVP